MVNQKIGIRKSQNTLTGVVMSLIIIMAVFTASYLYFAENTDSAGLAVDSKFSDAYVDLNESQSDLESDVENIKENVDDIREADTAYEQAWNGLLGLGNILKLPITFVTTTLKTFYSMSNFASEFIPGWALALIYIAITAFVVFLVIKVLKGEPNM